MAETTPSATSAHIDVLASVDALTHQFGSITHRDLSEVLSRLTEGHLVLQAALAELDRT